MRSPRAVLYRLTKVAAHRINSGATNTKTPSRVVDDLRNAQTDRRRLEYSRVVKEEQCYVPLDFNSEVHEYGAFRQKAVRVCKGAQVSPKLSHYQAYDSRE